MYGPLGYFIVSPELVFLQACETIRNTAGWEQAFTEYMKGIHPGRMIASVRTEDVVGLPGVGIIANRSPLKRAVDYVLLRLLAAIGCEGGQYTPQIIGYRRSPYIAIDEVCDRVCASRVVVPNAADLKLDIRNKWGGLPAVFQTVIRNTAAVGRDRRKVREAIRTQLADIGYRTSRGYQPTGHEKSLLLCYGNAGVEDGPGRTRAEKEDGIAPVIGLAPHDSALVTQTWGEVQKVIHCGRSRSSSMSCRTRTGRS